MGFILPVCREIDLLSSFTVKLTYQMENVSSDYLLKAIGVSIIWGMVLGTYFISLFSVSNVAWELTKQSWINV